MAGNTGFYQRNTRKLNVLIGSRWTDASKYTKSLPNASGVSYFSGQPLWVSYSPEFYTGTTLNDGSAETLSTYAATIAKNKKILANPSQNGDTNPVAYVDAQYYWTTTPDTSSPCFFAKEDSDEWDGSGKNMAVSCLDKFEIQTPFFDTSKVYKTGAALTAKSISAILTDGVAKGIDIGNRPRLGDVVVTLAASGDPIIGFVTEGVVSVSGKGNISVVSDKVVGGPDVWTESSKTKFVLQFETSWGSKA